MQRCAPGLVGVLEAVRTTSVQPDPSGANEVLFDGIAAAVIGGTLLAGGSGTVVGALIGALLLGVLNDGLIIKGVNADYLNFYLGLAIIIAMAANTYVGRVRTGARTGALEDAVACCGRARHQALRPGRRAARPQPAPAQGRGARAARRQRRRQVDADEDHLRLREARRAAACSCAASRTSPRASTTRARSAIDTVYQDLALIDELSVFQNMFLRRERVHRPLPFLANRAMRRETRAALDEIGINIPSLNAPVARLSGGQRQAIAVARTVHSEADILLLDEPLAAMGAKEGALHPRPDRAPEGRRARSRSSWCCTTTSTCWRAATA